MRKIGAKVRGQGGLLKKNGYYQSGFLYLREIKGKEKAEGQDLDELLHLPPELHLNGGVIFGSLEVLINSFLIERNLGVRVVYLNLKGLIGDIVQNVRKSKGGCSFRKCFSKFGCVIQSHSPGNGLQNRTRIGVSRDSVVALWVAWGEGWS